MGEPSCRIDGREHPRRDLTARVMNFDQHWRTPGVQEVDYEVTIPRAFVLEYLTRELPDLVDDSKHCPDADDDLGNALRAADWPDASAALAQPALADLVVAFYQRELLTHWLGAGAPDGAGFVANTITSRRVTSGDVILAGRARRPVAHAPLAYQDV